SLPIVKILRDQYEHQLDEDREIRGQYERLIQEKERKIFMDPGEPIRYRIPSDSMGSYYPTKSRWIPG
ncbi:unnamed protein product, partial [Rotaria socialis]